jgi:catechol 2,3-dioxygenase-like lactoylglutathione lyase family enzyme
MTRELLRFGHVSFEVASIASSQRFHDRFLGTLGFRRFQEGAWYLGYRRGETVVWFFRRGRRIQVHRELPHLPRTDEEVIPDHVGFWVPSWAAIVRWEDRLRAVGIEPLYPVDRGPPRSAEERYRSAAWTDPDRIVWEIYALRGSRPHRD